MGKYILHFKKILLVIDMFIQKHLIHRCYIIFLLSSCAFATVLARQRAKRVTKLILVSGGGPVPLAPQPGVFSLPICILACIKPCISCLFTRYKSI